MDETLYHHGILGQRWGLRRSRATSSNGNSSKAVNVVKGKKHSSKKNISKLTDKELSQKINRLKLEKEYRSLLRESKPSIMNRLKKVANLPVGYTKDGKVKKLGPVVAGKLMDVALKEGNGKKIAKILSNKGN